MFRRKPSRCRGKQGVQIQETEKRTKGERSIVSLVTRKTKEEWSFRRYSKIDPGSKRGNDLSRELNGTSCKWKNQQIKESNVSYRCLLLRLTIARICLGRWKIRSFTKLNPTTGEARWSLFINTRIKKIDDQSRKKNFNVLRFEYVSRREIQTATASRWI